MYALKLLAIILVGNMSSPSEKKEVKKYPYTSAVIKLVAPFLKPFAYLLIAPAPVAQSSPEPCIATFMPPDIAQDPIQRAAYEPYYDGLVIFAKRFGTERVEALTLLYKKHPELQMCKLIPRWFDSPSCCTTHLNEAINTEDSACIKCVLIHKSTDTTKPPEHTIRYLLRLLEQYNCPLEKDKQKYFSKKKLLELVQLMVENNIGKVTEADLYGNTLLHIVPSGKVAHYLIEQGADIDATTTTMHQTPLIKAVQKQRKGVVRCLLLNGANVNHRDDLFNTAQDYAKKLNNKERGDAMLQILCNPQPLNTKNSEHV